MTIAEFREKYCQMCGSQRCEGPGTEWFGGCIHRGELTSRGQRSKIIYHPDLPNAKELLAEFIGGDIT